MGAHRGLFSKSVDSLYMVVELVAPRSKQFKSQE